MSAETNQTPSPTITVYRKISPSGNRCWYYAGGFPHEMCEALAIKEAQRGKIKLKTIEHG
jgi:hypothetical protein